MDAATGVGLVWLAISLLIWGFFIWASATLASNRGRNPWVGGLLGGVLGILGLFIVAITPSNRRVVVEREERWRRESLALAEIDHLERWKREGMQGPPPARKP